ncbi:Short chain dehydrogenase reductase [Fusarium albosuccineum]|uniref:Short chain dehydrogenase reductase n=1 Tax=Fusarium albosuccineum TaxID=1237068 RepID=A0A8H4P5H5_9HYPO|nr:Short chain dehydrogenase reductase [Fusarium albosuccineum]
MAGDNKVVIVTGGASGLGLAMVRWFVSNGNRVAIFDINSSAGSIIVEELGREFPDSSITFACCDIQSWEQQLEAFKRTVEQYGRIDIVVANAGIAEVDQLLREGDNELTKPALTTLNVNLVGLIYTVKLAVHYIKKNSEGYRNSRGSIICTASNAGIYPFPVGPIYGASKFGVVGLVRSLARPLESSKIQINALLPAVFETNIASDKSLFNHMKITPIETLIRAVGDLLSDTTITGAMAELHGDSVTHRPPHEYVDSDTGSNLEKFWELGHC